MDIESLAKELILKNMNPEQQLAVLEGIKASVAQAKEVQKQRIGENVGLVVDALKKIESDIRSRYDEVGTAIEHRVNAIKDGRDGINGQDGKNGKDGRDGKQGIQGIKGKDGRDGRDGVDGTDGVSVTSAHIDFDGSLIIGLSSGVELNVGEVLAPSLAESIKVITNGGGTSQSVIDTLASLQTQITNLIPSQTGNSGKFLTTNGTALSWANVAGGLTYQGTWNASTNTPTLASSTGTNGYYYIVATAGSTNLNGITDWQIGDWLMFNGSVWQKIDQSNTVTSVNGQTGAVSVGTVTSVAATAGTGITVTGSPITSSGTLTITNSAPDQTVALTQGGTTTITGTYPNFTISSADQFQGTVTSVTGTSPVASSGGATPAISLASGYGDTLNPYASKTANFVLAAPNGSAGVPTFRAVVAADIPTLNQNTTGTASNVTGTVAIANGGTNSTATPTSGGIGYGTGTAHAYSSAGTAGQVLTSNGSSAPTWATASSDTVGFKNRIINGAMVIDQRNAGASVTITTAEEFIIDRWQFAPSASSKLTAQQSSTAPTGFNNSLLLTSSAATSVAAGDYYFLGQKIEGFNFADCGWGTASAATITLSFWCRSSVTGTYGGALVNSAQNRSYPFSYTISTANTFEYKTITIAGDTSGTWIGATNGTGVRLRLGFGVGSTYSGTSGAWAAGNYMSVTGATNWISTSGATFYITGVQLEKGSTATSFYYRPITNELALCQRYCQVIGGSVSNQMVATAWAPGTTSSVISCLRPVQMRASPTLTYSALGDWQVFNGGAGTITPTSIAQNRPSSQSISMEFGYGVFTVSGQAGAVLAQNTSAKLIESAEL